MKSQMKSILIAAALGSLSVVTFAQQKELNVEKLQTILSELTHEKCLAMAMKARALGKPEATEHVANICIEVAR